MSIAETFAVFVADETAAIDELKLFVGGSAASALNLSSESIEILEAFLRNLTSKADWYRSPVFHDVSQNMEGWLAVRVAYYLAAHVRALYRSEWTLCADPSDQLFETPIMTVGKTAFSPLQVGHAAVRNEVHGGLPGFMKDLASAADPKDAPN